MSEQGEVDLLGTTVAAAPRSRLTERDMLDRLADRYGRMVANGPHRTLR